MISVKVDRTINKIVINTADPTIRWLLEFKRKVTEYEPWKKSWVTREVIEKLYINRRGSKNGIYTFILGLGWVSYLLGVLKNIISVEDYDGLVASILSDSYREAPFPGLRDYQNQDVLHILKYRIGLVTVNTGYGKI